MHFLKRNAHTSNLFKNLNILKFPDKVSLENCILICKYFNQSLPKSFKNWFTLAAASGTHNIRWSNSGCLKIPSHNVLWKTFSQYKYNLYMEKFAETPCQYFVLFCFFLFCLHLCTFAFFVTKHFYYSNWIWVVIYQFRVIPLVFAVLYGNRPLTFKLNHILPFSRGCHHWRCSVNRGVLGGFAGFVGRCGCCGLFLIKLQD